MPRALALPFASRPGRVEVFRYADSKELAAIVKAFQPATTDHIAALVVDLAPAAVGDPSAEQFGLRDGPYGDAIAACSAKMLSTLNVNVL